MFKERYVIHCDNWSDMMTKAILAKKLTNGYGEAEFSIPNEYW